MNAEYSIMKAILPLFNIISIMMGGILGDYFDSEKGGRRYRMRGYISALGSFIIIPSIYLSFFQDKNFWLSIGGLVFAAILGMQFFSSSFAMVNNMMPP
jgi:hypothetical protein